MPSSDCVPLERSVGRDSELFDTENDDDLVTAVSWMKNKQVLAIGTSSKKIHLWDTVKF